MKLFRVLFLSAAVLCAGVAITSVSPSCATVKSVAKYVNNPDSAVGSIVANCAKPEIANLVANVLASLNKIAVDPSTTSDAKNVQIAALKKSGQESLACALREGVTDITVMVTGAAQRNAALDPKLLDARDLFVDNVAAHSFTYSDGWQASAYLGLSGAQPAHQGTGGRGGAGGSGEPSATGGAGGSGEPSATGGAGGSGEPSATGGAGGSASATGGTAGHVDAGAGG